METLRNQRAKELPDKNSTQNTLWDELEHEADAARFTQFSRGNASQIGAELIQ
jgi:hypothetical protein